MKELALKNGKLAFVDDEDFLLVSSYPWNSSPQGYAVCTTRDGIGGERLLHRIIAKPSAGLVVDHINRNKLDCRRINLRVCTASQNCQNREMSPYNKSGYFGVSWHRAGKKWQAHIGHWGKGSYIGLFDTALEAARAYDKKALEVFGPHARIKNV